MSRTIMIILILVFFSRQVFSQEKSTPVYVKLYGGYSFSSPGATKGQSSTSPSNDTTFFKVGEKSFGEGLRVGIGAGVILNDYINLGIDAEYLKGTTMEIPVTQVAESVTTINHSLLSVIPNITFKAVSKPSYHIYTRLGIIVGIPLDITEDYTYHYATINTDYHAEYVLKTGIGYQASLGAQIRISDQVRILFEISAYLLSLNRIKYEEIQKLRSERTSLLPFPGGTVEKDNSRNIINYVSEGQTGRDIQGIVYTYTYPQDPINLNTMTLNLGVFFRF